MGTTITDTEVTSVPGAGHARPVAILGHGSQQLIAAAIAAERDTSGQGERAAASLVEGGAELSAEAYVEGLDGAERALLLRHIARAWPDVVEAGVRLVADWRVECAEHRRTATKDRRRERRRRQRGQGRRGQPPRAPVRR